MKNRIILVATFISLLPGFLLEAEGMALESPALSLAQAQVETRQYSPELRRWQAASEGASWKRLEAVSAYVPRLSVGANQILDQQYLYLKVKFGGAAMNFPEAFPSSTLDLNVSETLFDGLGAWHRYQAADLARDAARLELEDAAFHVLALVRLRYYQALAAVQLARVADQNIATLQDHLQRVQAAQDSGLATRFEVLRVQSKLDESKAEKLLEDDNAVLARGLLQQAMGISSQDSRELSGELPIPEASRLAGKDLSHPVRADLQAQSLRADAASQMKSASGAFWFPRLSVFGQQEYYHYDSYDPAIVASDGYQRAYTVGLNLNWDLFDGGLSLARQKQAGAALEEAQQALKARQLKTPQELDQWRRRYLYNSELYKARLRTLEESQESVRLAELGLKAGTLNHSESLDAESDLFRARAGLVRAQMDAAEATINLELALGKSLD